MDYTLIAYSGIFIDRNLDYDKIILSPKLLANIINIENNNELFIFKLTSMSEKYTHCTVLEFISNDESIIYLPVSMMNRLEINEGDQIKLTLLENKVNKPERIILKPLHSSFLKLNSYKEILENSLRNYSVITKGDILNIDTQYNIETLIVVNIYPENEFGCILNTNIEVEFEEPLFDNSKEEVKEEVKQEIKEEVKQEIKQEIKDEIKDEIKQEVKEENLDIFSECKNCCNLISIKSIKLHEIHCFRNYIYCNDCKYKILKSNFSQHIHCTICNIGLDKNDYEKHYNKIHKKVKCEYCLYEVLPSEINIHLISCEYLPITCKWCKINVPLIKIEEHEHICSSKTIECEICSKSVIIKNLVIHNAVEHDINPSKIKPFYGKKLS